MLGGERVQLFGGVVEDPVAHGDQVAVAAAMHTWCVLAQDGEDLLGHLDGQLAVVAPGQRPDPILAGEVDALVGALGAVDGQQVVVGVGVLARGSDLDDLVQGDHQLGDLGEGQ